MDPSRGRVVAGLVTAADAPARAWHLGIEYGVREGARADLQLYASGTWEEVLRLQEPPLAVWHRGRMVARNTTTHELIRQ